MNFFSFVLSFSFLFFAIISHSWALPKCSDSSSKWTNCYGELAFKNGERYEGEFQNNKFNGQGKYTFSNGAKYDGEWKNGEYDTFGLHEYPDGAFYIGEYKNNQRNGLGTFTHPNGKIEEGIWKNNRFQYAQKKPNFSKSELSEIYNEIKRDKKLKNNKKKINYKSNSKITRTLSNEKTRPYARKCAELDKDINGSYKFFKGFINDTKTHSSFHEKEARQAKLDSKETFSVIITQEFQNVAGDIRYRVAGCEFTLDEGMQVVYRPFCDSFSSHIPFISKTGLKKNFEEYFFYRDQIIIKQKNNNC